MVAKSKAGTTAQIKKKIAAARTEADRRALVFELKKAERAEKAKPVAKAKPAAKTKPKPKTKSKAETSSNASAKKLAAKSTKKAVDKSVAKTKPAAVSKTTISKSPKAKIKIVAKETSTKEIAKKPKTKAGSKASAKPTVSTKSKAVSVVKKVKLAKNETVQANLKEVTVKTKALDSKSNSTLNKSKAKKIDVAKSKVSKTKTIKPKSKVAVVKKKVAIKAAPEQKRAKSAETAAEVNRQLTAITERASVEKLESLAGKDPYVVVENLNAGYGKLEILKNFSLSVARKQSLCLIGPNGAGKSTVLHAIFGFNNIFSGTIKVGDGPDKTDVTQLPPNQKLNEAGIAYILQDKSILNDMTVEENLWMGGFLKDKPVEAKRATEQVFDKFPRLAKRRKRLTKTLSSGERRLVEICRALVMDPQVLLVDEPSLGLKQRSVDMVFEFLHDLQHKEDKTIILVENDVRRGLEFADIGYVLINGEVALADSSDNLLATPKVRGLFPEE